MAWVRVSVLSAWDFGSPEHCNGPDFYRQVNNNPQSGWLDSPSVRGVDQGHVSAIGALFREPSPKAMVYQKTIYMGENGP